MRNTNEYKIRFNVVLIFLLIASACCGIFYYFYNLQARVAVQKEEVERDYSALSKTNELIYEVNMAQTIASFYVSTKKRRYLHRFRKNIASIDSLIDSMAIRENHPYHNDKLREISKLLNQQATTMSELNKQVNKQNPVQIIHEKIQSYEPPVVRDTLYVSTMVQDTVVNKIPKRGFFRRIADVFSPAKHPDSIVVIKAQKVDTIKIEKIETPAIIMEVDSVARQASITYDSNIKEIEKRVGNLIASSQEISSKISTLLLELHRETLDSTLLSIQNSEQTVTQNYLYSLIGGGCLMMLILIFILLIIRYVSMESTAHKALKEANERTRQIMESRHQLLLSVSHDIKTPLGSILGYLELWKGEKRKEVESMRNSGKHILSLLENLLKFSSLEQGTLQVTESEFSIDSLYKETADMFEPLARQKGLVFERIQSFDKDMLLSADSLKIKQVIINILSNAVKYTVRGDVRFDLGYEKEKLIVKVTDTGVGIPQEKQQEIFHAFSRVESNNAIADGTGLGMYVVKGLVDLLGGTISVRSEVNRGTHICAEIPVRIVEREIVIPAAFRSRDILVVDDDATLLTVTVDMLRRLGHNAVACDNPQNFESVSEGFEIILTDMEMGDFSGEDILRKSGKLPVVIMTARADFSKQKAEFMGFSDYLPKPFSIEALRNIFGGEDTKSDFPPYEIKGCVSGTATADKPDLSFPMLEEMFEGDKDAIRDILQMFDTSTGEHIEMLRESVAKEDFAQSQAICHKMLPMFAQLEDTDSVEILRKMDSLRGAPVSEHPFWKEEIGKLIPQAEQLRELIRKY